mmetsp:Transcript_107415/g.256657  ORF Transcript_107415/g.256657 Transcript_107415/m.256657 type:complete len:251 (+) Transcript_107415:1065-1817(+)
MACHKDLCLSSTRSTPPLAEVSPTARGCATTSGPVTSMMASGSSPPFCTPTLLSRTGRLPTWARQHPDKVSMISRCPATFSGRLAVCASSTAWSPRPRRPPTGTATAPCCCARPQGPWTRSLWSSPSAPRPASISRRISSGALPTAVRWSPAWARPATWRGVGCHWTAALRALRARCGRTRAAPSAAREASRRRPCRPARRVGPVASATRVVPASAGPARQAFSRCRRVPWRALLAGQGRMQTRSAAPRA